MHSIIRTVAALTLLITPLTNALAQSTDFKVHRLELLPPPQAEFHDRMGGWPTEMTPRTFHAARGTLTIYAHEDGRTDLVFDIQGLLPYGVYTFWDVIDPDFDNFKDRPLMNVPLEVDPNKPHWWNDIAFDPNGGPNGFGQFGFMANQDGRAHVVVNLDHRPGREFLLDYHADGHVRGGQKGKAVFPGVLWTRFPDWEAPKTVELEFVDHVKAGMIEQDVYVEKSPGEGQVYRIEAEEFDAFKNAPLYATTRVVHHAPFSPQHNGPYPKGRELGMTMAEWLSGTGKATYTCEAGTGTIDSAFTNLVPNGLYTMWHAFVGKGHMGCADCPFATIDFPVGDPDGSGSVFTADDKGDATFHASFKPCLEKGTEKLAAMLAIAYHSDGKTYGPDPGPFGIGSHVQLFTGLPQK